MAGNCCPSKGNSHLYVSHLKIHNFRNFGPGPFEIKLKPTTLVVGENNIGKSNLLLALALIFPHDYVASQPRALHAEDFNYAAVKEFRDSLSNPDILEANVLFPKIQVEVRLKDFTDEQKAIVGDWFSAQDFSEACLKYTYAIRSNFDKAAWIQKQREILSKHSGSGATAIPELPVAEYRATVSGGASLNECEAYSLRMLRLEILDALRDAKRELTSGEGRVLFRVLKHSAGYASFDLEEQISALQDAVQNNRALGQLKTEIGSVLQRVSLVEQPDDNSVDFRFFSPDSDDVLSKIALVYGMDPVSVERNGLGRNNLLFLGLLVSQLCKPSDPKGSESYVGFRIIGVEEPEAHLHPHLQEHLASNLEQLRLQNDKQLQLLLTSHSTHITSKIDLDNTVVVYKDRVSNTLRTHYVLDGLEAAAGKRIKRFLSLYLDATKSKMLFARKLILVEGIAEQTVIPRLFEREYRRTLESVGCTVVNVQGLAFRNFLEVVRNGYFAKCAVITDLDSDTDRTKRGESLKEDYRDVMSVSVHISKQSTFEKDLIAENTDPETRTAIWEALLTTRPTKGSELKVELKDAIEVDRLFSLIEEHKAAFAFYLAGQIKDTSNRFNVPRYICEAFEFLEGPPTSA